MNHAMFINSCHFFFFKPKRCMIHNISQINTLPLLGSAVVYNWTIIFSSTSKLALNSCYSKNITNNTIPRLKNSHSKEDYGTDENKKQGCIC